MYTIIHNGLIYDAVHEAPFVGNLLIDGGRIAAIGKNLDAPAEAQVVDASGLYVYPGLVEAHGHIGLDGWAVGYEGQDYNEYNDPVTPQLRAIDGINPFDEALQDAVRGGVTTLCTGPGSSNVLGGTFAAFKPVGTCIDAMCLLPQAAMKCAFGENPKGCYGKAGGKAPMTRMGTAALLRELFPELEKSEAYLAALLAQGFDPWFTARCAVWLHGATGDLAAAETGEYSLAPSDLIRHLPAVFRKLILEPHENL